MEEALGAGNMDEYKKLLKNQRALEKVWSNMTGGQSTLGKLRLNRQLTGTIGLETAGKNLIQEFKGNIKIRENIAKNIDESVKFYDPKSKTYKTILQSLEEVHPVKSGTTKTIESVKKLTSPELLKIDKEISQFLNAEDQTKLSNTIRIIMNKQNSGLNVVDIAKWGRAELSALDDIAGKIPSKALGAFGKLLKTAGIVAIPLDAVPFTQAHSKGLTPDGGAMNLAEIYSNLPGMIWEAGEWVVSKAKGKEHESKPFYEFEIARDNETKKLQDTIIKLKSTMPSKVIRIKLNEVANLLGRLRKKHIVEDKDVLTMLRYYELVNELKKVGSKK